MKVARTGAPVCTAHIRLSTLRAHETLGELAQGIEDVTRTMEKRMLNVSRAHMSAICVPIAFPAAAYAPFSRVYIGL